MLNLQCDTPQRWLVQVDQHLDEILIDHAHCERKAASTAMHLMFAYIEREQLARDLTPIVNEELEHYQMVLDILKSRNIRFRRLRSGSYGKHLHELIRKLEPGRAVDRLLVAAMIEARSCERFVQLQNHLPDRQLAEFFGSLLESEARHYSTYVRLAKLFAPDDTVKTRLNELMAEEARIIQEGDPLPRVHS
jgi:tRNA-(ms[2]io[6]A)-hydroxylase